MLCVLIYLGLFSLPCLLSKQMTATHINGYKVATNNDSGFLIMVKGMVIPVEATNPCLADWMQY